MLLCLILFFRIVIAKDYYCQKDSSKCRFINDEETIAYFSKGIYGHEDTMMFLNCVNGIYLSPCLMNSEGKKFYNNSGIFIAAGIDLAYASPDIIKKMNLTEEKSEILVLFTKKKNSDYSNNTLAELIMNNSVTFDDDELKSITMTYYSELKPLIADLDIDDYSRKIALISLYAKYRGFLTDDFYKLIEAKDFASISYYVANLPGESVPKEILSRLIAPIVNYFKHHLIIFFESSFPKNNFEEIKKLIMEVIKSDSEDSRFTIVNSTDIICKECDKEQVSATFGSYKYFLNDSESFNNIIKNISKTYSPFNEDRKYVINTHYQQIVLFFGYKKESFYSDLDNISSKYIMVLNRTTAVPSPTCSLIIYQKTVELTNNTTLYLLLRDIASTTSTYEFLNGPSEKKRLMIQNITTITTDSYQYFKIKEPLLKENEKIRIELKYLDYTYNNLTIFHSDKSFPGIRNWKNINYGRGQETPYIEFPLEPPDPKEERYFFIGVYSENIKYTLNITVCSDNDADSPCSEVDNNGKFGTKDLYNFTEYYTFGYSCFSNKSEHFKDNNCSIKGLSINSLQGIEDKFDFKIFNCLYKNFYCGYVKKISETENKTFVGYDLELTGKTPYYLKKKYKIPRYLIHVLYPFLNDFEEIVNNTLIKNNVEFSEGELFYFEEKFFRKITDEVKSAVLRNCGGRNFTNEVYFALVMSAFENSTEKIISGDIIQKLCSEENEKIDEAIEALINLNSTWEANALKLQFLQSVKRAKDENLAVSIIIEKDLLFHNKTIEKLKNLLRNNANFAFSIYNANTTKIDLILNYFSKKCKDQECEEKLEKKLEKYIKNNKKHEGENEFDMNKVLEQQKNLFKLLDYGLKKIIMIITNENETFNYDYSESSENNLNEIKSMGINIIQLSNNMTRRERFSQSSENFFFSYDSIENFPTSDILLNFIRRLPIPITNPQTIVILKEYQNQKTFSFNLTELEKKKNLKNFDVKFSFSHPNITVYISNNSTFPSRFQNNYWNITKGNNLTLRYTPEKDKTFSMTIVDDKIMKLSEDNDEKEVEFLQIDIDICIEDKCEKEKKLFIVLMTFIIGGGLILVYGMYNCFCDSVMKKEGNIFQQ